MRIVILEDNEDRQVTMKTVLEDRFPAFRIEFFVASSPMIDHLTKTGLYDVALISLDNDLEMIEDNSGQLADPGDGVDVVNWLCTQPAVVPVIVHTTNMSAGNRMMELLSEHGWVRERIVPYDGEIWISATRNLIVQHSADISISSLGVQILKSGQQHAATCEEMLKEIIRATSVLLCDSPDSEDLCLELVRLGANDSLVPMSGTGFSLFRALGGGASIEIIKHSAEAFGAGPVAASDESLESGFRGVLRGESVGNVQFDVVQPAIGNQAMMLVAVKCADITLQSHRAQSILRETRSLLELLLLWEIQSSPRKVNENQPEAETA